MPDDAAPGSAPGLPPATMNLLIQLWFDGELHNPVNFFCVAPWKPLGFKAKDFTGELFIPHYLIGRAEFVRFSKESQNGLENPEDRRSAGRHGNQHVCVRRPQVSGSQSFTFARWTSGLGTFPEQGTLIIPASTFEAFEYFEY